MSNQLLGPDNLIDFLMQNSMTYNPLVAIFKPFTDAWKSDRDELAAAKARIAELHKALAMTNCMIKCGDYHSEQSEQIVRKALDGD